MSIQRITPESYFNNTSLSTGTVPIDISSQIASAMSQIPQVASAIPTSTSIPTSIPSSATSVVAYPVSDNLVLLGIIGIVSIVAVVALAFAFNR